MKDKTKAVLVLIAILVAYCIAGCVDSPKQKAKTLTELETRIAKFFIAKGVEDPVNKAVVIASESKYPYVAAAQAYRESRVKVAAVGNKKEKGAFQVREKYWGKVPRSLEEQTRQHNKIMDDLLKEVETIPKAIQSYNGAGSEARKYKQMVCNYIQEI